MRNFKIAIVSGLLVLGSLLPANAADLKSPDTVKTSLRLIMQVTNDFARQIDRKNYVRLPGEMQEFTEAAGALRQAIANEPADFKAKVEPAIQKALAVSEAVADLNMGPGSDDAALRMRQAEQVKAVNAVFAFFPEELRPDPNVQPGRGRGPQ